MSEVIAFSGGGRVVEGQRDRFPEPVRYSLPGDDRAEFARTVKRRMRARQTAYAVRELGKFLLALLLGLTLGLALAYGGSADAATIQVSPGAGTIQAGINKAVSGDTVQVNAGNYSGGFTGKTGVAIISNGTVWSTGGATMTCSSCQLIGLHFDHASLWISGSDVLVQNCEFNGKSNEDYSNAFGNRITIRHCWFHGVKIPQDLLLPDGTYQHEDVCQFWNNNGEVLNGFIFDDNIITDTEQGLFLANETGLANTVQNITITNNVFWGTTFANFAGMTVPSHGFFVGKAPVPGVVIKNNTVVGVANEISLYNLAAGNALVQGNLLVQYGTAYALNGGAEPNRGTGNWDYTTDSSAWLGGVSGNAPDVVGQNPQIGAALLGPSGDPWGADAGYWPRNVAAAKYGRQATTSGGTTTPPPANTPPTVTLSGPSSPITLAAGQTTASFTVTANGSDAEGPVTYSWSGGTTTNQIQCNQPAGTQTYSCTVTDSGGLTATATLTVVVNAAPVATLPTMGWLRVRVYNSSGVSTGYAWVWGTTQAAQPTVKPY